MPSDVVQFSGISKSLGGRTVLSDVSLNVPEGRALAVIGHNASGKTTLLNIISTLWSVDSGGGTVLGFDIRKQKREIRRRVGYAAHDSQLYADLTVQENLIFFSRLGGLKDPRKRIAELLDWFQLQGVADTRVRQLSMGLRKRVSIVKALLMEPLLLLFDEPYANLDPAGRALVEEAMKAFISVGSVVLTAHSLEGVPLFVKEKVFLQKGKVVRQNESMILTGM